MQAAGLGNGGPPQSPQAPDRRSCVLRRGRMAPSGGSLTALARPGTVRKPSWLPGLFPDPPSIAVDGPVISVFDRGDGRPATEAMGVLFGAARLVELTICLLMPGLGAVFASRFGCLA